MGKVEKHEGNGAVSKQLETNAAKRKEIQNDYLVEPDVVTIDALIQKILDSGKQYDLDKIVAAYELAESYHHEQKRESGEPYIIHPLSVAYILLELGMDTDTICAALLHDVVEDTECTIEQLEKKFGHDVAMLVDGVTKLGKYVYLGGKKTLLTKDERKAESLRKMLLAMSEDIRVIIIKLADRLHNMRTLKYCSFDKQTRIADETLSIYAPIAHRLGIKPVKEELEDLAFFYLDPFAYAEIEEMMELRKSDREILITKIKDRIAARLARENLSKSLQIDGRVKSNYGIYKKVYLERKDIEQVYDKYAVRVIVDDMNECYCVLGVIHDMFRPLPNRFKDYISTPKSNMYQSLHTTVIGREGVPFEVQIRTWEMHRVAEYGIAAHWKYKEGLSRRTTKEDNRVIWARQIIEAQQESDDIEEITRAIKNDLAMDDVCAITPSGDPIVLPKGSTVIDFAYAIHTEVGHKMSGAKADGKMVSYNYQIKTGEIINILTSNIEGHGPSRSWLDIAKTNSARSKIRAWFKRERREENIYEGRTALEREFRKHNIHVREDELEDFLKADMKRHNCETLDDFFAAVGYGGIQLVKVMQRLRSEYEKRYENPETPVVQEVKKSSRSKSGVIVDGIEDCVIKFAQCCNPLPGDEIVGFITRGHGVSVHKSDCANYLRQKDDPENSQRWISVHWEESKNNSEYFKANLDIIAVDRIGLLADVTTALSMISIYIYESSSRELKNGNALLKITISVAGMEQLASVMSRLREIKNVISVERSGK